MLAEKKSDFKVGRPDRLAKQRTGPLGETLSRIESVIKRSPIVAINNFDRNGVINKWSAACKELYGYTSSEATGKCFQELLASEQAVQRFEQILKEIWDTGLTIEVHDWTIRTPAGQRRTINSTMLPVFNNGAMEKICCMSIKIPERIQVEAGPVSGQEWHNVLLETITHGVRVIDTSGVITFANRALHNMYGYSEGQLLGRKAVDLLANGEREKFLDCFKAQSKGQILPIPYESRIVTKDGRTVDVEVSWNYMRNEIGRVEGFISIITDITARKRVEEKLCEERNLLRTLIDSIPDRIYVKDRQCRYLINNKAHLGRLGAGKQEDVTGRTDFDFFPSDKAEQFCADDLEIINSGQALIERQVRQEIDGKEEFFLSSKVPLCDNDGNVAGTVGINRDISRQKQTEEQLQWELSFNKAISRLSGTLLNSSSVEEIPGLVLGWARQLTQSRYGYVGYIEEESGRLVCTAFTEGFLQGGQRRGKDIVFKKFGGLSGWVLKRRKSLLTNSAARDRRRLGGPIVHIPVKRFMSAPSVIDKALVGQIVLADSERDYAQRDMKLIKRLAELYALAVQRNRTAQHIENLARFPSENLSPVLRIAENGMILYSNIAGLPVLNYWGCNAGETVPEEWRRLVAESIANGRRRTTQIRYEGSVFSLVIAPAASAGYANIYGYDVTEQRKAEQEILKLTEDLEQRVAERTDSLVKIQNVLLKEIEIRKQTDALLAESEEKYRAIFEQAGDAIIVVDADTAGLVGFNRKAHESLGYTRKEFKKLRISDFEVNESKEQVAVHVRKIIEQGSDIFETKQKTKNGRICDIQVRAKHTRIRGKDYIQAIMHDITDVKSLEREVITVSEREKRLIGQELHDSLGQQIAGLAFMAKVLENRIASRLPEESERAAGIARLANEAMEQSRDLAKGLHPVDLDKSDLVGVLKQLARGIESLFSVNCRLKCRGDVYIDDNDLAVNLYRIAQEGITNAIKHGRAKNINIRLIAGESNCLLIIQNDGVSFDRVSLGREGLGMRIMQHRADIINGSLGIRKGPKGGAILTCKFPDNRGK
ncbi:MAG: PAS domain S-box protein [Planctomycetota bacterium]